MASNRIILGSGWYSAKRFLPYDLDGFAIETQALSRRRGVRNGELLTRALCLCALPKATYGLAAQTAKQSGIASLSGPALFNRMVGSEAFLKGLFVHALGHAMGKAELWSGYRLLAVDATSLSGPGSKGTDQRLHVVYDLGKALPLSVELTGATGGEGFGRHSSFGFGDLLLGDRGYGKTLGLESALRSGAHILVRISLDCVRLLDEQDEKIWPEQAEGLVPVEGPVEFCAYLPNWVGPLRVIGGRNQEGKTVWLLTDLPAEELALDQARDLYSRRWQVELYFKRLKSLLDLGELTSRDGPSARPWVWAKLLLATLAVLLSDERFSPWEGRSEQLDSFRTRGLAGPGRSPIQAARPTQTRTAQRQRKT